MGYLVYGQRSKYRFDDRTLAHLKIAIASKLRLQEGFLLSWSIPGEDGNGRMSLWLSPMIPLQFVFNEPTPPKLNRTWLEAFARSSHGMRGMVVLTEEQAQLLGIGDPTDPAVQRRIQAVLDEVNPTLPPLAV